MGVYAGPRRRSGREIQELLGELEKKRGLLIAFEGPDGAGKTTQRKLFKTWLKGKGYDVVSTKWNSSALIRPLVSARKSVHALSPVEYCLLHACDFRQRLETEILPALCAGKTVIADRYLFTALARDVVRGLDMDWVLKLYAPLLWPDMVFHFSLTPETSHKRAGAEGPPSYYESGQDLTQMDDPHASYEQFMGRVIQEYEALALIFQFMTIDAEESVYAQHKQIRSFFEQGRRRSWPEYNGEAVAEWLALRPEVMLG
jgi:dTMP kinase